jgi:hypothetical protein
MARITIDTHEVERALKDSLRAQSRKLLQISAGTDPHEPDSVLARAYERLLTDIARNLAQAVILLDTSEAEPTPGGDK